MTLVQMRFMDWIEKSRKTPRGKSEVEANRKLRQPGTGNWWGYFNFGIVVLAVWQKNQIFSWKKQEKPFLKPEVVLNQFDKFFGDRISDVFFKYTSKKTFVKPEVYLLWWTGSCLEHFWRIFLMFSLKKTGKAYVKPEAFSWVNRK